MSEKPKAPERMSAQETGEALEALAVAVIQSDPRIPEGIDARSVWAMHYGPRLIATCVALDDDRERFRAVSERLAIELRGANAALKAVDEAWREHDEPCWVCSTLPHEPRCAFAAALAKASGRTK